MNISDILKVKGGEIVTAPHMTPLRTVASIFMARNVSSVVITAAGGHPVGLVTDRIIVKAIAAHGAAAVDGPVRDVLTSIIPKCTPDTSVRDAMQVMTDRRIRHLLVEKSGRTVGIVSIGDLVKGRLDESDLENRVLRDMTVARHARF